MQKRILPEKLLLLSRNCRLAVVKYIEYVLPSFTNRSDNVVDVDNEGGAKVSKWLRSYYVTAGRHENTPRSPLLLIVSITESVRSVGVCIVPCIASQSKENP